MKRVHCWVKTKALMQRCKDKLYELESTSNPYHGLINEFNSTLKYIQLWNMSK